MKYIKKILLKKTLVKKTCVAVTSISLIVTTSGCVHQLYDSPIPVQTDYKK